MPSSHSQPPVLPVQRERSQSRPACASISCGSSIQAVRDSGKRPYPTGWHARFIFVSIPTGSTPYHASLFHEITAKILKPVLAQIIHVCPGDAPRAAIVIHPRQEGWPPRPPQSAPEHPPPSPNAVARNQRRAGCQPSDNRCRQRPSSTPTPAMPAHIGA